MEMRRHPVLPGAAALGWALWKLLPGKELRVEYLALTPQIPCYLGHLVNGTKDCSRRIVGMLG